MALQPRHDCVCSCQHAHSALVRIETRIDEEGWTFCTCIAAVRVHQCCTSGHVTVTLQANYVQLTLAHEILLELPCKLALRLGLKISIWRIYCTCRPDAGCPPLLVQKAGPDCSLQHNTSARSGKWIDLSDGNHADAICIFNNQNPTRTPAKRANVIEYNITQPQDFLQRGIGFITKTLAKHTIVVDKNLHTLRGFLQRGTVLVLAPIPWLPDKSWQAAQDRRSR